MSNASEKTRVRDIPFARPMIGEEERSAVLDALASPTLVHGPRAEAFEDVFAEFTGAPEAVSLASCTAAMYLAYLHLGLGEGDEVIVPAQTHVSAAHAVEAVGSKPVFVDAEERTGNIDISLLERAVTDRTKAITVVHFLGRPVDMERVMGIAKHHSLFVLEDCALALGSYYNGAHAGLLGDVGCFSFYPVKHITTAEGGMLITRNEEMAERMRRMRAFGVDRTPRERSVPGEYDVPELGLNFRMNELQAALGVEQMKKLPAFLEVRRRNAAILLEGLAGVSGLGSLAAGDDRVVSSEYCYGMLLGDELVDRKANIIALLKERGVGTSVYYPRPVPHLTYYKEKYGYEENSFPAAASISRRIIALPVGPHLTREDMNYIVEAVKYAVV